MACGVRQLGILLLAFAVRCVPIRSVFVEGQVIFTDSDSYYHLRRIAYNLAAFPETLGRDPYLNFPDGAEAIWPQTLDWLLALLLRPFCASGGAECQQHMERILVWVPPVLGGITVWLLYRIALRHFGARVALASALVLCVLPAHYWYSQIGFLDHHVVVALCATLLLGGTLELVRRCQEVGLSRAALVGPSLGLGALLAANLLIWPGSLLYVALSESVLLVLWLVSAATSTRRHALDGLLVANVMAFVLIGPFSLGNHWSAWGTFSAVVLTNFQPWWFALLALFAGAGSLLFDRVSSGSMGLRLAVMVPIGLGMLGVSIASFPELEASVRDSAQWLGRTDDFQAMVGESMPLFMLHGKITSEIASSRLSYFIYLFPFVVVWLCYEWRSHDDRPELYAFLAWALVLFGFTVLQKRFFNTFSVALALSMGIALVKLYDGLGDRFDLGSAQRKGCVVVVAVALLSPSVSVYRGDLVGIAQAIRGASPPPSYRTDLNLARSEMTSWLRRHTPETTGYLGTGAQPEYGVLARWGEGHFITYEARRPTAIGNFGDDLGRDHFLLARSFFTARPRSASETLDSLGVRYVVIRSRAESRSMAKTLFSGDGSRLGRYRMLYEVRPLMGRELPSYKIFEFVRGAELTGSAPPRSLVVAQLDLVSNLGREFRFEMVAEADLTGRYRLRLPYATRGQPESTRTATHYQIRVGDKLEEVAIEETAVQQGEVVPGPSFAVEPGPQP